MNKENQDTYNLNKKKGKRNLGHILKQSHNKIQLKSKTKINHLNQTFTNHKNTFNINFESRKFENESSKIKFSQIEIESQEQFNISQSNKIDIEYPHTSPDQVHSIHDLSWIFEFKKLETFINLQISKSKKDISNINNTNHHRMITKIPILSNLSFCLKNEHIYDLSFNKGIY